jgi:hypothetical protein
MNRGTLLFALASVACAPAILSMKVTSGPAEVDNRHPREGEPLKVLFQGQRVRRGASLILTPLQPPGQPIVTSFPEPPGQPDELRSFALPVPASPLFVYLSQWEAKVAAEYDGYPFQSPETASETLQFAPPSGCICFDDGDAQPTASIAEEVTDAWPNVGAVSVVPVPEENYPRAVAGTHALRVEVVDPATLQFLRNRIDGGPRVVLRVLFQWGAGSFTVRAKDLPPSVSTWRFDGGLRGIADHDGSLVSVDPDSANPGWSIVGAQVPPGGDSFSFAGLTHVLASGEVPAPFIIDYACRL